KGFAGSLKEAFKKYIGHLAPAYVAKKQKKLPELVKIIRDCGGIPVIAHPGLQGLDKELQALKDSGIEGVEVFHPDHASALTQKLLEESERLSLLITGGSDYHGSAKENLPLGIIRLPCRYAVKLKEAHRARVH
ncbi:MAG: phosphatase, partial [Candidatus Aureabacteria bacterium]|nr:phosphatase [Candidatus Auribacterota bacterium]